MPLLQPQTATLCPYTTLFRSELHRRYPFEVQDPAEDPVGDDREPRSAGLPHARQQPPRSEEHTSELQSHHDLVCRLLLEKKKEQLTAPGATAKPVMRAPAQHF